MSNLFNFSSNFNYFHNALKYRNRKEITICGYPTERNGHIYEMWGTINEVHKNEESLDMLTYTNIDATQGQTGAPVLASVSTGNPEIIAVNTNHLQDQPANGGN
jgi:V8-like Glu-specific endopeptidase